MNSELPRVGHPPDLAQQHVNKRVTLNHRIAVAAADHNHRLLNLLIHEQSQLESNEHCHTPHPPGRHKIALIWHQLAQAVTQRSQLSLEHLTDTMGHQWWHVADPRTGKTFNAESLNAALHWIEENRLGQ